MKKCLLVFCSILFVFICATSLSAKTLTERETASPVSTVSSEEIQNLPRPNSVADTLYVVGSRLPSFERAPRDIPANASLVSSGYVENVSPAKFQETLKHLEGVSFFDGTGNARDESLGIRGFSSGNDAIVLVDGVRVNEVDGMAAYLPLIQSDNIESVEIVRGSASAVYGSGAFGGVVNIITKKPSEKPFTFFGGADYSSFGGVHFYDGISGTLQDQYTGLDGGLGYYFEMGRNTNAGFRDNGDFRETPLDFKLHYELPDEQGGIRFNFKNVQQKISNPGALTFDEYQQDYSQTKQPLDGRRVQNKILSLDGNRKFWDDRLNFSVQASIRRRTSRFWTTFRTFTDFADGFDPDTDLVTTRSHEKNFITQLAYQDTWDFVHYESLFGIEMNRGFNHDTRQDAFMGNVVERTGYENIRNGEATSVGIFGHERIKLWDQLSQDFGIRGNYDYLAFTDERNHANDFNRHWRSLSISTGTVYGPVKWGELFWNFSQAFRVPQFHQVNSFGGDPSANLNPERAKNFEFGSRFRYNDKAQFKASYFHIVTKDEIMFDSSSRSITKPFGRNANAGKTLRKGIELYTDWKPLDEMLLYGTYTFTHTRVKEAVEDPTTSFTAFQHRALGQVPQNRFTLGLETQPLQRLGAPYDGLHVLFDAVFVGEQHTQDFQTTQQAQLDAGGGKIKPYQVFNFKLSYEWKNQEVFFKINNLFDERYFSRGISVESFGTATTPAGNYFFVNPAPPREFLLGTRYEFGG